MNTPTSLGLLGACVLAATLSLLRYAPVDSLVHPGADIGYGVMRVPALTEQLADPTGWEHFHLVPNALRWRLLPPTVGHLLHLWPRLYLVLPLLGAALLLAAAVACIHRETQSAAWAALAAVPLATASWFFVTTGWLGQFDAYYLLGLLLVTFAPSGLAVWGACVLAPWCDERFLLLLPACVCLRWARSDAAARRWLWPAVLGGIAPYVLLRLWAVAQGDPTIAAQLAIQRPLLDSYLPDLPDGWWMGFRAGWVLIGVGLAGGAAALGRGGRVLLAVCVAGGLAAVALLAWDISRSIAVLLPFLVHGAIVLRQRWPRAGWRILAGVAVLNLVLPASHVVKQHRLPIRSVWPRAF
jgi:hypothetical protein